jgi:hypothetical protein
MLSHTLRLHQYADHRHNNPHMLMTSLVPPTLLTLMLRLFLRLHTTRTSRLILIRSLFPQTPTVRVQPMLLEVCALMNWSAPVASLSKITLRHRRTHHPQPLLTLSSLNKLLVPLKRQPSRRRTKPILRVAGAKLTTTCSASSTTRACRNTIFSIGPAVHALILEVPQTSPSTLLLRGLLKAKSESRLIAFAQDDQCFSVFPFPSLFRFYCSRPAMIAA